MSKSIIELKYFVKILIYLFCCIKCNICVEIIISFKIFQRFMKESDLLKTDRDL